MKWMKRFPISILILIIMTVLLTSTAYATSVDYQGSTNGIVFTSQSQDDLFDNFKNTMPGDTLTETITITNSATDCDYIKLYLKAEPVNEDETMMLDFLSQMTLTLYQDGTEIYDDSPDETGALTEYHYIGQLSKNSSSTLEAVLEIPVTIDNEFQNATGDVIWVFYVEAYTNSSDDVGTTTLTDSTDLSQLIQTGQLTWPIPVMMCGGTLLISVGVVAMRKKERNE